MMGRGVDLILDSLYSTYTLGQVARQSSVTVADEATQREGGFYLYSTSSFHTCNKQFSPTIH